MRFIFFLMIFISITGLVIGGAADLAQAAGQEPELTVTVTPTNLSFKVADNSSLPNSFIFTQKVNVGSHWSHPNDLQERQWFLGIVAEPYLVDTTNPANQIPISKLSWSKDGVNFYPLSTQWIQVSTYTAKHNHNETESITYRIQVDDSTPGGTYIAKINYRVEWTSPPWD